ncbi:hypothetical protein LEMLEM_LOCUS3873, partial [Lemmus lemmus]
GFRGSTTHKNNQHPTVRCWAYDRNSERRVLRTRGFCGILTKREQFVIHIFSKLSLLLQTFFLKYPCLNR